MLSHRHRAGARRPFAALLAAVAVVAPSVMFLSAPPASADEPPPALDLKIRNAVMAAKNALQRPECNALLSGGPGFVSAVDVLNTASTNYEPVPPPPLPSWAIASSLYGRGLNQVIHIHNGFDMLGPGPDQLQPKFSGRTEIPTTDYDVVRALTILHEVGHISGVEALHEARVDEAGRPISADEEEGLYN